MGIQQQVLKYQLINNRKSTIKFHKGRNTKVDSEWITVTDKFNN